ncbi:MAG: sigma 54-interacting transcriptional regulator [Syntrophobacteraceae bacterium]
MRIMRPRSLRSKLLVGVSALVICSGLLISLLVSDRYNRSLSESMSAQAEYLTHAVALQAADLVLINDLVSLQKLLDHLLQGNPSLSYLFIVKDGQVLAHTFSSGMPSDLLTANEAPPSAGPHPREIASTSGDHFLDMAMPIFEGKAGTLRLGFSEKPYHAQITKLWLQMSLFTLAILLLALTASLFFIRRIAGPLSDLARAADKVDKGELGIRVPIHGQDEVANLTASFNNMVSRLHSYTRQLEDKSVELERAHQQTRTFCGVVQEVGSLQSLREIGSFLIRQCRAIVGDSKMVFLIRDDSRNSLYILRESVATDTRDPAIIENFSIMVESFSGNPKPTCGKDLGIIKLVDQTLVRSIHQCIVPIFHEGRALGVLVIGSNAKLRCETEEFEVVGSMLSHAGGVIKRAIHHEEEVRALQSRLESSCEFCGIVSKDPKMQMIFRLIEDIAPTDATVLIQGESGTGKELVARAIHLQSLRKDKPFVVIDCSAYPATILESELFGHEKGAFTGAIRQKPGRFEQAHGGTVFLDEIGDIPLSAQIKLLRVLQTQRFERIGGEKTVTVDVRIIAATNKNLLDEVKSGRFREDLFYRLSVIPIDLPQLSKRRNDVPLLALHFMKRFSVAHGKAIETFSPDAMRLLLGYPWPGNVRELENTVEHAVVLSKSARIEASSLPEVFRTAASNDRVERSPTIDENEKNLLRETMEGCGWNKKKAADRLGISRSTLYEKLKRHRIVPQTTH